jgi:hypothetical protein
MSKHPKIAVVKVSPGRSIAVQAESTVENVSMTRGKVTEAVKVTGHNPVLITAKVRDAESAPTGSRVKVAFTMPVDGKMLPLPLAQATVPATVPAFSAEIRLEMN